MTSDRFSAAFSSVVTSVLVSFCVLLPGSSAVRANPIFSVQNIGSLGAGVTAPSGFNSSGTAVGLSIDTSGDIHPLTFSGGTVTQLPGSGEASGINDAGTVIGTTLSGSAGSVTEWLNGQSVNLNIPGYGTSINGSGQVAGSYLTSGGQSHAFTWTAGTLRDLGTLGGTWSSASAINGSGQAAGTSTLSDTNSRAFFYDGSRMLNLGTLGGVNSYANALSAKGEVAGASQLSSGYLNAFAWTSAGMVDLGTLGGLTSSAYGVNNEGAIVGYSFVTGNAQIHGFLDLNGVMLDLNGLLPAASGWTITGAYAIDDAGQILATGTLAGQSYALELDPQLSGAALPLATPEPASYLLFGTGLILLAARRCQAA